MLKQLATIGIIGILVSCSGGSGNNSVDQSDQETSTEDQNANKLPSQTNPGGYVDFCKFKKGELLVSDTCSDGLIKLSHEGVLEVKNVAQQDNDQGYLFKAKIKDDASFQQFYRPVDGTRYAYDFGNPERNRKAILPLDLNYKSDGISSRVGMVFNQIEGEIPEYKLRFFNDNMQYRPFLHNIRQLKQTFCPVLRDLYDIHNGPSSYRFYEDKTEAWTDVTCEIKNYGANDIRSFSLGFKCLKDRDMFCYATSMILE